MIERLQERARNSKTATDEGRRTAAPLVTPTQIKAAETRLRVSLPTALQRVYLEVGNGGFGPGDGLFGLSDALLPGRLYPLCDWGSGISSALDCTKPEAPIIRIDPNMAKADVPVRVPEALHFDRAAEVKQACWVESASLEGWLTAWLDGQPLFYAAYRGADDEDDDEDMDDEKAEGEEEL